MRLHRATSAADQTPSMPLGSWAQLGSHHGEAPVAAALMVRGGRALVRLAPCAGWRRLWVELLRLRLVRVSRGQPVRLWVRVRGGRIRRVHPATDCGGVLAGRRPPVGIPVGSPCTMLVLLRVMRVGLRDGSPRGSTGL